MLILEESHSDAVSACANLERGRAEDTGAPHAPAALPVPGSVPPVHVQQAVTPVSVLSKGQHLEDGD